MEGEQQESEDTQQSTATATAESGLTNASRPQRLVAAIIDGLIIMAVVLPLAFFSGGFQGMTDGAQPSFGYSLFLTILGIGVFALVNGKLLRTEGKTLGKRIMRIKIVTLDGQLPDIKEHFVKRYAVYFLLGLIPFLGQLLSLINVLLIFGSESRCGHDMVAGTRVVLD